MAYELNPQGVDWLWQRFQQIVDPTARATVAAQKQAELAQAQATLGENTALQSFIQANPGMAQGVLQRQNLAANAGETTARGGLYGAQAGLVGTQADANRFDTGEKRKAAAYVEQKGLPTRNGKRTLPGAPINVAPLEADAPYKDEAADREAAATRNDTTRAQAAAGVAEANVRATDQALQSLDQMSAAQAQNMIQQNSGPGKALSAQQGQELLAEMVTNPRSAAAKFAGLMSDAGRANEWRATLQNATDLGKQGKPSQGAIKAYDAKYGAGSFMRDQQRYGPVNEPSWEAPRGAQIVPLMEKPMQPSAGAQRSANLPFNLTTPPSAPLKRAGGPLPQTPGMDPLPTPDVPVPGRPTRPSPQAVHVAPINVSSANTPLDTGATALQQFIAQMSQLNGQQSNEDSARMAALLKMAGLLPA